MFFYCKKTAFYMDCNLLPIDTVRINYDQLLSDVMREFM